MQSGYELNPKLRHQSQQDNYNSYPPPSGPVSNEENMVVNGMGPDLPPRIDRGSKPPRGAAGISARSAQERLFGAGSAYKDGNGAMTSGIDPPNYINATSSHHQQQLQHHHHQHRTSLERHNSNTITPASTNVKTVNINFINKHRQTNSHYV